MEKNIVEHLIIVFLFFLVFPEVSLSSPCNFGLAACSMPTTVFTTNMDRLNLSEHGEVRSMHIIIVLKNDH